MLLKKTELFEALLKQQFLWPVNEQELFINGEPVAPQSNCVHLEYVRLPCSLYYLHAEHKN